MKLNRIILPLMACALTWSSCDDQIMEWKNSDGRYCLSQRREFQHADSTGRQDLQRGRTGH